MSAATSSRSCATWWRSRSRYPREEAQDVQARPNSPPKSAWSTLWSAPAQPADARESSARSCAPASSTTRKSRSRCRPAAPACRCSRSPACRARRWAPSISATFSASSAAAAPRRGASTSQNSHEILVNEESDKLLDNDHLVQESITCRAERHRVPRRNRQDLRARGPLRRRRLARGRAARPAAADRRHHRRHQARRR